MGALEQLKLDKWYQGLTLVGALLAVGAFAAHEKEVGLLGIGAVLFGLGYWKDYRTAHSPPFVDVGGVYSVSQSYYKASVIGVVLSLVGIILMGRAIWRIW